MSAIPTVERQTGTIGAEICGLDLSIVNDVETYDWISEQLVEHKVLFFRKQNLTSEQHIAFGEHFGDVLDVHPWSRRKDGYEKVMLLLNGAASNWHSDETWRDETPMGSALYCRIAPKFGGDTLFADMERVFADLPKDEQSMLEGLYAVHDHIQHRQNMRRLGVSEERIEAWREEFPEVTHPIVRTHPVSGRKSLYVNGTFTSHIVGMSKEKSKVLLNWIYGLVNKPQYQCRFRWEENSMAFWDNRSVQHYGVPDFGDQVRHLERVTISGPKPV